MSTTIDSKTTVTRGYAPVNGLEMYYEIEGSEGGDPLVYIPNAFGFAGLISFPALIESRSVITMDLQGHGRTADIPDRPLSIEQYARDVVALLKHLGVARADFFGFSFGGNTAAMIALHHPRMVRRVATWGATFGPGKVAHNPAMLRFDHPPTADDRAFAYKRDAYKRVAPHQSSGPRSGRRSRGSHGKASRAKSWRRSRRRCSSRWAIATSSASSMPSKRRGSFPTPSWRWFPMPATSLPCRSRSASSRSSSTS